MMNVKSANFQFQSGKILARSTRQLKVVAKTVQEQEMDDLTKWKGF